MAGADGARYSLLYKTDQYRGEIQTDEGEIFWTTREELLSGQFKYRTFAEMLPVFDKPEINELALYATIDRVTRYVTII